MKYKYNTVSERATNGGVRAGRQEDPRLAMPPLYRSCHRHFESTWRHMSTTSDNLIHRCQSVTTRH